MKKGFTLIELVFTIVILAITTMAIPRIVAQTVNLNMFAVQQELVYNAKSMMSRIQPAKWDSNYCIDDENCIAPVIQSVTIAAGNTQEIRLGTNRDISARTPTPYGSFGIGENNVSFGGTGLYKDMDDFNLFSRTMTTSDLVTGDFVLQTTTNVAVHYVADPISAGSDYANSQDLVANFSDVFADGAPTDVKWIRVTSTNSAEDGASVALNYYAFNIGSSRPDKKSVYR
ncbi:type II secretion system GspH family protein [Campylobacter sp. VBCF_06 NA8]|uniref:type II secretion system protein n=1 Tax=Campylobacter sp. VBCF_06 NA8 TaxID=2983822 RepID=UPI0022E9F0B0|nr:type II secretion system protein [Campylobacter sp. VBCF_06 NA8]MDA3046169.1 type II secretion system GspH family protein [Campylobacter sp. VBCF_06 NA8]